MFPRFDLSISALRQTYSTGDATPSVVLTQLWPHLQSSLTDHLWIHMASLEEVLDRCATVERHVDSSRAVLWGMPFAVKDNIDVAGWPTTAGCPAFAYTPTVSATIVEQLLDAGAILVGKTNLDQFATGLVGTRSPYGTPLNPTHPLLPPGGSSSGSAVAVAVGLVSFALGTDTAGSGRVPTALTSTVGLKPAPGRWSTSGIVPACHTLDCVSVFATSVHDVDRVATAVEGAPWGSVDRPITVGVPSPSVLAGCSDDVVAAFRAQLRVIQQSGHRVVEVDLDPFLATGSLLYDGPWVAERAAAVGDFIRAHPEEVEPIVAAIILGGFDVSGVDVVRGHAQLESQRRVMVGLWEQVEVLVTPTIPSVPTLAEIAAEPFAANHRLGLFTHPVNLLGLCSVSVPGHGPGGGGGPVSGGGGPEFESSGERLQSEVTPTGITVVAPPGREALVSTIARAGFGEPFSEGPHPTSTDQIHVAVVGAHLSGQPLNHQLCDRGGHLLHRTTTTPNYRLLLLNGCQPPRPGLERVADGGTSIEVEIWSLPTRSFGEFVSEVPPPLGIGTVELVGGRSVKGFICEPLGLADATDISVYGGWRTYLAARTQTSP